MDVRNLIGRVTRHALCFLGLLIGLAQLAAAETDFPTRPITIVVPYPPGGTTDVLARALQQPLQTLLKQPVVIENKPGAAAVLGTKAVARAPADGYTLLIPNNGLVIAPLIQREANYSPLKDFEPVSLVSVQPMILVAHPSVPADSLPAFIAYARANPDTINYATAGTGSFGHLATELFSHRAGVKMVHIPYKGLAPSTLAIVSGEAKVLLSTASSQLNAFVKDGRIKLLGVASPAPTPMVPGGVPMSQTLSGFNLEAWFGLVAPAGTPPDVVAKLNAAINTALKDPDLRARLEAAGAQPMGSTPQQLRSRLTEEYATWSRVVREAKISLN